MRCVCRGGRGAAEIVYILSPTDDTVNLSVMTLRISSTVKFDV